MRALTLFGCAFLACGAPGATPETERPIILPPMVDLAPAAALDSLVIVRPREILAHAELVPLLLQVTPNVQLQTFAARHGGVDPRQLEDLVVATYGDTTLVLAQGDFDGPRIERAFGDRTTRVTGRFIDRPGGPLSNIVRLEGSSLSTARPPKPAEHLTVALFGRRAVGIESHAIEGRVGPLRVSELFAMGKLQRSEPALRTTPLDTANTALGDAPIRLFFPGPFEGESAKGLAGLLGAATAVAIAVRLHEPADAERPAFEVTLDVFGAWNDDAPHAGQRLAAAVDGISRSDLGRLCGLHEPISGPTVRTTARILTVFAVIDARKLAAGARAATGSQVDEIMSE